jgi:hypothetical protein
MFWGNNIYKSDEDILLLYGVVPETLFSVSEIFAPTG